MFEQRKTDAKRAADDMDDQSGLYQHVAADDEKREAAMGTAEAERMAERHDRLMGYLKEERDRQAENRYQMAKDEDYYDGLQWEPEDAQVLMDRGQAPIVFNKIKPTVEWVLGTEKRTRIDGKVLPREQDDERGAEVKTKVMKYVSDVNRVPFARSAAFAEQVIAGLGWLEDAVTRDPSNDIIYSGSESWRNLYRDSRDRTIDLSASRYCFRQRVTDLDIAKAIFPKADTHLDSVTMKEEALEDGTSPWYLGERLTNAMEVESRMRFGERGAFISTALVDSTCRQTVRLLEGWYRVPEAAEFFASGPFAGKMVNKADPLHLAALRAKETTYNHVALRMRCMIATESAPLWDGPSPYRHNRFPFTPLWCYRRKRDGEPYGIVRGIRDIQDDLNKRRSKALYILSNNRIVVDEGAVEDLEQLRAEAARADGVIVKKAGLDLRLEKPVAELEGNVELMMQDESLIQDVSGVQSELLGKQTNATSGRAIIARQEQGGMVTAGIFDNLRLGIQLQGEIQLSLIEQFYTEAKVIRLVGARSPMEWVPINQLDPTTGQVINDITARQADFIVSEQDYRASLQQAAAEQLADVLAKVGQFAPQMVVQLLDLYIDLLDVPNKEEFVNRVRKMNGQRDPTKAPTPEEIAVDQQNAQRQAEAQELQRQMALAQLAELAGKGDKVKAEAIRVRVQAMLDAVNAGGLVATQPILAPVADEIMRGAGFVDNQGQDPNIPQPAAAAAPMPAAPAQQGMPV